MVTEEDTKQYRGEQEIGMVSPDFVSEKPSPPSAPENQNKTAGKPPPPLPNQPTTHGAGKPTPPPNQGTIRGGGK